MKTITVEQLLTEAKFLTEGSTNVEYNRAICELIAGVTGREGYLHSELTEKIAEELNLKIV